MSEQTPQLDSSPAEAVDVFNGETPTLDEFNKYRETGEIPERFKPAEQAESAPADDQEETEESEAEEPEPASESEPEDLQELTPKAKKRIQQLLAERHELRTKLEQATKKEPVVSQPEPPTHPKPTIDDKNADGSPKWATYEDFTEAVGRWAAKEERSKWEQEFREKEALAALQVTMDEARTRYEDADDVIFPTAEAIKNAQIPLSVKDVFGRSKMFVDLCYVAGSDPKELESFIKLAQRDDRAAMEKVFEWERGIKEELSQPRDAKGKFAPEKKTAAPKPPAPVTGATSRAFDVNDESLSADEWMRKRNAQMARA